MEKLRNPCLDCLHHQAGGDKNNKTCKECPHRLKYVEALDQHQQAAPTKTTLFKEPAMTQKPEPRACPRCHKAEGRVEFDSMHNVCKSCLYKAIQAGKAKKKVKKGNKSKAHTITIDFSGCPEILEGLKTTAEGELRTLENQALYLLKQGVEWKQNVSAIGGIR